MYDTLSIGSAVVDVFIHSKEFNLETRDDGVYLCKRQGEKIEIDKFTMCVGGGGANTAVSFSRLGFRAGVICELGHDTAASIIRQQIDLEHVSGALMIQEKLEHTGGSVIMIGPEGGRSIMVSRGAASMLDPADIPVKKLKTADWIHLSSIGGRVGTLKTIWEGVENSRLSWNPGRAELLLLAEGTIRATDIPCQIFSVNSSEWQILTPVQSEILHSFTEVIVTDGKKGGAVFVNQEKIQYQAQSLTAVDETGAGDSFISAYVAARLNQLEPDQAIAWGLANAASVVGQIGAQTGLLTKASLVN